MRSVVRLPTPCIVGIDCSTTIGPPCAATTENLRDLSSGLEVTGLYRRPKIESSEDFTQQVLPHRRANARMAFRQTFHCVPKGVRRWLTYSFSARAPVRPISTGLKTGWVVFKSPPRVPIPVRLPSLRPNAQMGAAGRIDRPRTTVTGSATA